MDNNNQIQKMDQQNQIQKSSDQHGRFPLTISNRLPKINRDELEFPLFRNSGEEMFKTLNRIVSMLAVQFPDEESRKMSGFEWITFVGQFQLTCPEIISAYNKALKRELKNESNETIKLWPNLSLITAGEVLTAFIEFKRNSAEYEAGRRQLHQLMNPEKIETPEEKKKRLNSAFNRIVEMINEGRESEINFAFLLWDDLLSAGKLADILPTDEQWKEMEQQGMIKLVAKESLKPLFYNKKELSDFKALITAKKELPVNNIVRIGIRDEIVIKYVKSVMRK